MYGGLSVVLGYGCKPAWCGWPRKDSKKYISFYKQKVARGWKVCFEKQYKKVGGEKYRVCRVLGHCEEIALEPGRRCGAWGRRFTSGGLGSAPASRTQQLSGQPGRSPGSHFSFTCKPGGEQGWLSSLPRFWKARVKWFIWECFLKGWSFYVIVPWNNQWFLLSTFLTRAL